MASEFDPIRPVHPSWRGRPVPERGDESKRSRRWPNEDEDEDASDTATDDSRPWPDADPSEPDQTEPDRSREPPADGAEGESGQHVDDYA